MRSGTNKNCLLHTSNIASVFTLPCSLLKITTTGRRREINHKMNKFPLDTIHLEVFTSSMQDILQQPVKGGANCHSGKRIIEPPTVEKPKTEYLKQISEC